MHLVGDLLRRLMQRHERFERSRREFERLGSSVISDGPYPRRGGCRMLLTEDLQGSQNLDGILVVNPFERLPESLSIS